jgi:hypothetical protein
MRLVTQRVKKLAPNSEFIAEPEPFAVTTGTVCALEV